MLEDSRSVNQGEKNEVQLIPSAHYLLPPCDSLLISFIPFLSLHAQIHFHGVKASAAPHPLLPPHSLHLQHSSRQCGCGRRPPRGERNPRLAAGIGNDRRRRGIAAQISLLARGGAEALLHLVRRAVGESRAVSAALRQILLHAQLLQSSWPRPSLHQRLLGYHALQAMKFIHYSSFSALLYPSSF